MKTNLVRSLIALVISMTGVFLSYYFLYPDSGENHSRTKLIVMAKVISVLNDVKKQGIDKFVWEPIRKGDLLYLGEKIKTSPNSSSKIEFVDNGAMIDIEPDSLIVVNKNNQKLSLQVVEGSLFVSSNKDITNLSVTSGEKLENTVNIKNGDFSYSVSKEGKANVEVMKGSIDSNNSLTGKSVQKFKDINPSYGENKLIDLKSDEPIVFKWSPLPAEYSVKLEMGNNRNNLIADTKAVVEHENGVIKTKAILGNYFWKLVAQNKNNPADQFSSSTFKVSFKQKAAPLPQNPSANEIIQIKSTQDPIEFKWSLMHNFDSIQLLIFSDENKNSPLITEDVSNQTFFNLNKLSKAGKYSWKLVGKLAGSEESLSSLPLNFQLVIGESLLSPIQLSPEDKSIIYTTDKIEKNIRNLKLSWKNVKEAKNYLLTIKNRENIKREFKVDTNEFSIPSLVVGTYQWSVQSVSIKDELSKIQNFHQFTIEPSEAIVFKEMSNKVYYTAQLPVYKFLWTQIAHAESYRLKISQNQNFTQSEKLQIKDNSFLYQIGKEGQYFAQVEALNSEESPIALSEIFSFIVSKPPAPLTPVFLNAGSSLESTPNGDITFELINFDSKYKVLFEIKDFRGALIEQAKTTTPKVLFKSLAPGAFYVTAKFTDEYNQTGESSERRSFIVPEKSAISAPKVKGLKVR